MRHFLRRQFDRPLLRLPCGVLLGAPARALVLGGGDPLGRSASNCCALAGAIHVAAITSPADAGFLVAARAAEDSNVLDHPDPNR
jgi:hypothetical protein